MCEFVNYKHIVDLNLNFQTSWHLVETCLQLFEHCAKSSEGAAKQQLRHLCLEPVRELAKHSDPELMYRCIPTFSFLGEKMSVSFVILQTWARWLSSAFYDDKYAGFKFAFDRNPNKFGTVGGLFYNIHLAHLTESLQCTLCQALHPHKELIQQAIISGPDWDKEQITILVADLLKHRCRNTCNTDWITQVLEEISS